MSKLFQEFISEVTEMGPKLLRGETELCRKLNLSKLLGNANPSSACAKSHWNFCPGAAQLELNPLGKGHFQPSPEFGTGEN